MPSKKNYRGLHTDEVRKKKSSKETSDGLDQQFGNKTQGGWERFPPLLLYREELIFKREEELVVVLKTQEYM